MAEPRAPAEQTIETAVPLPYTGPGRLMRRWPDYAHIREGARHRLPKFVFDYIDVGAGNEDGVRRNMHALAARVLMPRFGANAADPSPALELFGGTVSMPLGIAPMGLPGLAGPGADFALASAAQKHGVPYVMPTGASASIEDVAAVAPDAFWFQLYPVGGADTPISNDLIDRAGAAGARALVLTFDSVARPKRSRDIRNGLVPPFKLRPRLAAQSVMRPRWLASTVLAGFPRFANFDRYIKGSRGSWQSAAFVAGHVHGAFKWKDIGTIRRRWHGPLVVKGILSPDDAQLAVDHGANAVWISNHGGRMLDSAPASADLIPSVRARLDNTFPILADGGVRSGADVIRMRALGADMVFAGRALLFALGAIGSQGSDHMLSIFRSELTDTMRFTGVEDLSGIGEATLWRG